MSDPRGLVGTDLKKIAKVNDFYRELEENMHRCSDLFIGSHEVKVLNNDNYHKFLKETDVALIMYYDPSNEHCIDAKSTFLSAAGNNERENSAYGAVNCQNEMGICRSEEVLTFPLFRLFSHGATVDTVKEYKAFTEAKMKQYVEACPILTQPSRPTRPC